MTGPAQSLLASRRGAIVTAVNASTVTIQLGGDDQSSYDAPYLDSYSPAVGDVVVVLSNQGTHLVLGRAGQRGHVELIVNTPTGFLGQTSAGYAVVPGTGSSTFTKTRAGTRVKVDLRVSGYVTTAVAKMSWGVRATAVVGGAIVDFDVVGMTVNTVSAHTSQSGIAYLAGLGAGQYTFDLVIKRPSGTGANNQDSNDYVHYTADETA